MGLTVGSVWRPGASFPDITLTPEQAAQAKCYADAARQIRPVDYVLHIIPDSVVGAFVSSPDAGLCKAGAPRIFQIGDILQVLFFAVLFGFALMQSGRARRSAAQSRGRSRPCDVRRHRHHHEGRAARRVRRDGLHDRQISAPARSATSSNLILTFYATSAIFVLVVLGAIARALGFSILSFLRYIKDELLIVLGTSSSESALPLLMAKLERLGCSKQVVGLVVPTGYSFNLDGTNIYMTLATLFIAQALHVDLSLGPVADHPARRDADLERRERRHRRRLRHARRNARRRRRAARAGLAIVFGIDKFMSEVRALTNIIGNGVATIVVSIWEGELDRDKMDAALADVDAEEAIVAAELAPD